jgi:fluoride ion exporter CrcB/FEX
MLARKGLRFYLGVYLIVFSGIFGVVIHWLFCRFVPELMFRFPADYLAAFIVAALGAWYQIRPIND